MVKQISNLLELAENVSIVGGYTHRLQDRNPECEFGSDFHVVGNFVFLYVGSNWTVALSTVCVSFAV